MWEALNCAVDRKWVTMDGFTGLGDERGWCCQVKEHRAWGERPLGRRPLVSFGEAKVGIERVN